GLIHFPQIVQGPTFPCPVPDIMLYGARLLIIGNRLGILTQDPIYLTQMGQSDTCLVGPMDQVKSDCCLIVRNRLLVSKTMFQSYRPGGMQVSKCHLDPLASHLCLACRPRLGECGIARIDAISYQALSGIHT